MGEGRSAAQHRSPPRPPAGAPPERPPHVSLALVLARRYGVIAARVVLPLVVGWFVWRELSSIDVHAVRTQLDAVPTDQLLLALAATLAMIAVAGLYDLLAFPDVGPLSKPRRWGLGMLLSSWTNFLAVGPFGGPALRLYIYRRAGLPTREVAAGLANMYTGMFSGLLAWMTVGLLPAGNGGPGLVVRAAAALVLAPAIAAVIAAARQRIPFLQTEGPHDGVWRMGLVGVVDWGLIFVVFVVVARSAGVELPVVLLLRMMVLGHATGIASMIPGGIGSADAVWIKMMSVAAVSPNDAAAAVLLFRLVMYILPWLASFVVLYLMFSGTSAASLVWQRRIVGAAVGLNSLFLLASAAIPVEPGWFRAMGARLPLGVLEASHLVAVFAAAVMWFLVRGIRRGYRSAFLIVVGTLAASVLAHFLRGAGFEESAASAVLLLMLLGARKGFRKQGRVPIRGEIILATALAASTFFVLVGLIGSDAGPQAGGMWARLPQRADTSRLLRGTLLVGFVSLAFAIRQAVVPGSRRVFASNAEIDDAVRFIQTHGEGAAPLTVAAGDKGIWRCGNDGMVVYQTRGDKMIVFGDPVAAPGKRDALLKELTSYADARDMQLVFYQIGGMWMEELRDYGFEFFKLGEEGIVDLRDYSLAGGHRKGLRHTINKAEEAGVHYRVIEPPVADDWIARAAEVSDAWLADKGVREMQFSVGYFSAAYLRRFPLGVALDGSGRLLAFVNLLAARPGGEMTVDFVRYRGDGIDNVMDFVLVKSFLWAKERGYTKFNMGMAPLFDVGEQAHSPMTERLARQLFLHGERFYNYQGLHAYKEKFRPQWQPRYLAYQDTWDWAGATVAVVNLVQGRSRADRRRIAAARHSR